MALSHDIKEHPEVAWQEEYASAAIAKLLGEFGFDVRSPAYELPTAFEATAGRGPTRVVLCAEYDALPESGHACAHNLIAAMAVGATVGLARVLDDVGLTVRVFGTPAEEAGDASGKILLLEAVRLMALTQR